MKCPNCQHVNPEDAKYCQECGTRLIAASESVGTSSIPDAERKRVTALFSDLSGYTAMTEKLDPEEVKEITSSIFDGIRDVVTKFEGSIERFSGDGVLALFGVPRAHEDDPIRAIHAAMEIHKLVDSLSPQYQAKIGLPLSMHSGINTGLAVTADVNPQKGTHGVTGDSINVAARLSDLAKAGEILVGPDTHRASKTNFSFQPLKSTKVKGKSESVSIYKVISEKTAMTGVRQEMQVFSEMVGRDQELAKLELHILKAVNGQGSVVNVFGEPGIGKSRLLSELRQRDVISRVSFLEGRSISIGKNLSFHPIIDLFKQWSKIQEDDTQTEASSKLETAIRRVCGDEVDEVFPFIATMMGMKLSGKHSQRIRSIEGEALEKLILKNVRGLLIRSTELIPIVIVMEDLHWADTTSLELLESVFRMAQTHRVVFINVFRPGYWQEEDRKVESLPEWLPKVDFAEIALKSLNRQMGEALVNNMLKVKGLRHALKQQIVDRAGGNPFFIEEIVRSLIDEGAIVRTNGAFEVTEKIDHVVIPPTINDVLIARIDRLEENTRELVKIASVIGRSFFDRIIKDVADSIKDVNARLAYLIDSQIIRDRIRMQELEYLFKHALAQEAVYESTLLPQRKALHLKVAQSIEKLFHERLHEFYGMLAFHYSMADESEKAEEYMVKAGDEALKSSASSEALHYFQEALQLYKNKYGSDVIPEKLVRFEKSIALALYNKGMSAEASEYFDKVLISYGVKWPKHLIPSTIKFLIDLISYTTSLYLPLLKWNKTANRRESEILDLLIKRITCASITDTINMLKLQFIMAKRLSKFKISTVDNGVEVLAATSLLFSWTGLSLRLSKKVLRFAKTKGSAKDIDSSPMFQFAELMHNYLSGQNLKEEEPYNINLVDFGLRMGELNFTTFYIYQNSLRSIERGQYDDAVNQIEKLLGIADVYDFSYAKVIYYAATTKLLMKYRRFNEALDYSNLGIKYSKKIDEKHFIISYLSCQGRIQALLNNLEATKKSLQNSSKIMSRLIPSFHSNDHYICQFIYDIYKLKSMIKEDNIALIYKYKKQALLSGKKASNFSSKKNAADRIEIFRLMGTYYFMIDKINKAIFWWDRSIKQAEYMGYNLELSRTYYEIGRRTIENHHKNVKICGKIAEEHLEEAKNMFIEMDLQWDLDQLTEIGF